MAKRTSREIHIRKSELHLHSRSAFTLIELLCTIVVIGILAALIFGGYSMVMQKAAQAKCMGQLRQIGGAFFLYAGDHNGALPNAFLGTLPDSTVSWNYFLSPYVGISEDKGIGILSMPCPAKSSFKKPYSCYGANYNIVVGLDAGQSGSLWLDTGVKRLVNVDPKAFIVADSQSSVVHSPWYWGLSSDYDGDGVIDSFSSALPYNGLDFRHGGKANFFLRDGSIVSLTPAQWAKNLNGIWGQP